MRSYANRTHWVFTQHHLYAFYAGLKVPPELAVVPYKRVQSRRISSSGILSYLKHYRPEQLLLPVYEERGPEWKAFLNAYEAVAFEGELALLVHKTILRPP